MKLLITGSQGQVGTELVKEAQRRQWQVSALSSQELDITNPDAVLAMMAHIKPDAVINAAAYTAVDKAESEREQAFAVNRDGPENLALACAENDIPLIHYSTDYVFDGQKHGAYAEDDPTAPLGVYGESKRAGEQAIIASCPKFLIFRTSWVFSSQRNNFVKTMLRLGAEKAQLSVVADQIGKPTCAAEIARISLAVLAGNNSCWGVYHLAQPEAASWYDFAKTIFLQARLHGLPLKINQLNAIETSEYPTPAKRPANSVLDCQRLESEFMINIKPWRESLDEVLKELTVK